MIDSKVPSAEWQDLVDRLSVHGVRYLTGGSEWNGCRNPYGEAKDAPLSALLRDLPHATEARLKGAIVALLLRHPEHASIAERVASGLPERDPARRLLQVSIVAAAALQREWAFSLNIYIPNMSLIPADRLARSLRIPSPDEEYGRPCLQAAATCLRVGASFPFNYEAEWEGTVHRLLSALRRGALHGT